MNEEDKLSLLRAMCGMPPEDKEWADEILMAYLSIAARKILNRAFPYTHETEVPAKYDILQCEIALYLLNKRGAEGESSHMENGISRVYGSSDVPESLIGQVMPSVGVI